MVLGVLAHLISTESLFLITVSSNGGMSRFPWIPFIATLISSIKAVSLFPTHLLKPPLCKAVSFGVML